MSVVKNQNRVLNLLRLGWSHIVIVCVIALLGGPVSATEPQPIDQTSNGAFTGFAFVTDDPVWYEMFNRPETPSINARSAFAAGERGVIAVLFSNAQPNDGQVEVECEITAFEPSGETRSFPPGKCYEGPVRPPNVFYPSLLDLQFTIGDDDPVGLAGFEIDLRDLNSGRVVSLGVSFQQGAPE